MCVYGKVGYFQIKSSTTVTSNAGQGTMSDDCNQTSLVDSVTQTSEEFTPLGEHIFHDDMRASNLLTGFSKLYKNQEFVDVVLCVGSTEFPCHRNVLAISSPYFMAMFSGGLAESQQVCLSFILSVSVSLCVSVCLSLCLPPHPHSGWESAVCLWFCLCYHPPPPPPTTPVVVWMRISRSGFHSVSHPMVVWLRASRSVCLSFYLPPPTPPQTHVAVWLRISRSVLQFHSASPSHFISLLSVHV